MEKRLEKPLRTAVNFLESHSYRYAIIGGIALTQWGVLRITLDVEIKVLVPEMDYGAVRKVLEGVFSQRARIQAPVTPLIVSVEIDEITVDFLLALPGYEEFIIERAVRRDLGGWSAWFCSAEDLIIQKIVAGRGKDLSDVEMLLIEQHGKLDEAYIESWLNQFVAALEKPEILQEYSEIVERVKKLSGWNADK